MPDGLATELRDARVPDADIHYAIIDAVFDGGVSTYRTAQGQHRGVAGRRSRRPRSTLFFAAIVGLAGAWLAVVLWNGVDGDLGIITVHASIRPALAGRTSVHFPPFGSMSADTHRGPLHIHLTVNRVNIEETALWLKQHKSPQETADFIEKGMSRTGRRLAWLSAVVAAAGALGACVVFRVGAKRVPWAITIGVLAVAVPLGAAALTYDTAAFDTPCFEGEMARAPHLFNIAQQEWRRNSALIRDIPRVAARTAALYQRLESTGYERFVNPEGYYRVLVISDLHNNPVAVRFALDLAQTYQAQMVLVAGDLTDLGHPLEAELLAGLKRFQIPIVVVTGNHDSRATVAVLKTVPHLTVLDDGQIIRKGPISIMGFGDPASRRANTGSVNNSPSKLKTLARRVVRRLGQTGSPDILLVHNDRVAKSAAGRAKVIIYGHSHRLSFGSRGGSLIINPGTTGAAGIRYFSAANRPSYTAAVLHFAPGRVSRLRLLDTIKMDLPSGDFTVSRRRVGSSR